MIFAPRRIPPRLRPYFEDWFAWLLTEWSHEPRRNPGSTRPKRIHGPPPVLVGKELAWVKKEMETLFIERRGCIGPDSDAYAKRLNADNEWYRPPS